MSASKITELTKAFQDKTLSDKTIFFFVEHYYAMQINNSITLEEKNALISQLSLPKNYTFYDVTEELLNTEYQHELFMGEMPIFRALKLYKRLNLITEEQYNTLIQKL